MTPNTVPTLSPAALAVLRYLALSEFKDETNGPVFEIIDSQDRAIYLTIDQYADLVRYHPLYKELVERVKTMPPTGMRA